ncbi:MAG: hypothetical protein FJ403_08730 [Verrucomicrobia bacterium]|nr:hypothetical protein [Verrucomicrobiota bacterium]
MEIWKTKSQQQSLQKQLAQLETARTNVQSRLRELSGKSADYLTLKGRLQETEIKRGLYASKQSEAQLLQENALGYYRVYGPATTAHVSARNRLLAVGFLTTASALVGLLASIGLILLVEVIDPRIKTAADVQRVTKLPVLATLGDLRRMTPAEQANWAFRTPGDRMRFVREKTQHEIVKCLSIAERFVEFFTQRIGFRHIIWVTVDAIPMKALNCGSNHEAWRVSFRTPCVFAGVTPQWSSFRPNFGLARPLCRVLTSMSADSHNFS